MRDSFVFYRSFYEAIAELPDTDLSSCFRAIADYALNDIEPDTPGIAKTVFRMAKPQIDANTKRYQNGTKGGRPSKEEKPNDNQNVTKPKPSKNQTITKPEPNDNVNVNVNENVNVNVNDKTYTCAFEELWKAYPRKKEKAGAYKCYKARIADGFSEDELFTAVKRYADECRKNKTEDKYIKHASTFLGANTPFMDFLKREEDSVNEHSDSSLKLW